MAASKPKQKQRAELTDSENLAVGAFGGASTACYHLLPVHSFTPAVLDLPFSIPYLFFSLEIWC